MSALSQGPDLWNMMTEQDSHAGIASGMGGEETFLEPGLMPTSPLGAGGISEC